MAPGRKRGAKGVKTLNDLNLGDLVLAKVKGFPAWPAKISRPEDWDRAPDPKKYFVQFFGTEEIAFVAPADIQAFTAEAKNKVLARCKGKAIKYFSQAVKEICKEFEDSQRRNSNGLTDDTDGSALGSDDPTGDRGTDDTEELGLDNGVGSLRPNEETENTGLGDHGHGLERCSQKQASIDSEDVKPNVSCKPRKRNKLCSDVSITAKKDAFLPSSPHNSSCPEEENSSDNNDKDDAMGETRSAKNCLTTAEGDGVRCLVSDQKNGCSTSGVSVYPKRSDGYLRDLSNGTRGNFKDGACLISSNDGKKESFRSLLKEDTDPIHKKTHKLLKDKKHVEPTGIFQKDAGRMDNAEMKSSGLRMKVENRLASRTQAGNTGSVVLDDEDVLPPTKRHRRAMEAMSVSSSTNSENMPGKDSVSKNDFLCSDNIKSPTQSQTRRRAVRLFDDDEPKTPVHGGFTRKICASHNVDLVNAGDVHSESSGLDRGLSKFENGPSKETVLSSRVSNEFGLQKNVEKRLKKARNTPPSGSPGKSESERVSSKAAKPVLVSPKRSPHSVAPTKPVMESHKNGKSSAKLFSAGTVQKKTQAGSNKGSATGSDPLTRNRNQIIDENDKATNFLERPKSTPKSSSRMIDSTSAASPLEPNSITVDRLEPSKDDATRPFTDYKITESETSMKHLIAAAQAKRRQAQSQNSSHGYSDSFLAPVVDLAGRSPSLVPQILSFPAGSLNMTQQDAQQYYSHSSLVSPSAHGRLFSSNNQSINEELEEKRVSLGQQPTGGSLSGGTEAAVARDAFEGMIETLSRTKESIGRATRLAIDCAKYGIANEVVELLIRKLEVEPSFHRKVDLFFLVDSITQCSHNHKGIAGASYIPMVEASLPRLLGAAAPAGAAGRENRRQCLKVLRLWLERKILPESLVRRYMDDIGTSNDDTSVGVFLKRPSRSERSVDDPIREMDGMLVDEYGSNATFQLPGLPSRFFEEEEEEEDDVLCFSGRETGGDISPLQPTAVLELENCTVTPNDRRHCILEDVDGELEMEDVSGPPKDERASFEIISLQPVSHLSLEAASNNSSELGTLPEGSPPLPFDSPPATPPLPSSPPPPSPPPLPPSLPSPPPPPPPPPLPLQPYPLPPPPIGLPPSLPTQPPLPPQPPIASQQAHPLPPSMPSSSPQLAYQQPPLQHEYCGTSTVNQHVHMASDSPHVAHIDASGRSEMLSLQPPCFVSVGVCNLREPSGFNSLRPLEYGHSDIYSNTQASLPNQQLQPGNITYTQRTLHPVLSNQNPSGHFSYPKQTVQQHPPHPFPAPYSLANPSEGPRRYIADEQWRMPANEFSTDHQIGMWIGGGRTSSCSGPAFGQEGYFRPHLDRPPTNNVAFQPSAPNMLPSGPPVPGHGVSQMMPCRPDMSALNCWRPA